MCLSFRVKIYKCRIIEQMLATASLFYVWAVVLQILFFGSNVVLLIRKYFRLTAGSVAARSYFLGLPFTFFTQNFSCI